MSDLDVLLRTLKKNTSVYELNELDKKHRGIMVKFWRTHYGVSYPKFCGEGSWWQMMEAREPKRKPVAVSTIDVDAMIAQIIKDNP